MEIRKRGFGPSPGERFSVTAVDRVGGAPGPAGPPEGLEGGHLLWRELLQRAGAGLGCVQFGFYGLASVRGRGQ